MISSDGKNSENSIDLRLNSILDILHDLPSTLCVVIREFDGLSFQIIHRILSAILCCKDAPLMLQVICDPFCSFLEVGEIRGKRNVCDDMGKFALHLSEEEDPEIRLQFVNVGRRTKKYGPKRGTVTLRNGDSGFEFEAEISTSWITWINISQLARNMSVSLDKRKRFF